MNQKANSLKSDATQELLNSISAQTKLPTADIEAVLDTLVSITSEELRENGIATLLNLVRIKAKYRAATVAREGTNPFTGERLSIKAAPEKIRVQIIPTDPLKEFVDSFIE